MEISDSMKLSAISFCTHIFSSGVESTCSTVRALLIPLKSFSVVENEVSKQD